MNILTFNPTTNQALLLGRPARFWLPVLMAALFSVVLLIVFFTTSLVRVSFAFAEQAEQADVTMYIADADGETAEFSTFFGGFALIPRSTSALLARTAASETRAVITGLPLFGIPSFHLMLEPQHLVSKIGADTLGCNMVNQHGTFSHGCGVTNMVQINRPLDGIWQNTEVSTPQLTSFMRYKDGILGVNPLIPEEPVAITYMVPGGNSQRFELPNTLQATQNDIVMAVTDQSSANTDIFAVVNITTGEYVIIPDLAQINKAVKFTRSTQTNPQFNVGNCALNSTTLACYFGPSATEHDSTPEHQQYRQQNPHASIETRSLLNTDQTATYQIRNFAGASTIHLTTKGDVLLRGEDVLYSVELAANRANAHIISRNTDSSGVSGSSMFYTANNGVYEYIPSTQTAHLRFLTQRIAFPVISTYGDQVLFNAFVRADQNGELRNLAHVYRLNNTPLQSGHIRKEDFLPYEFNAPIVFMDYSDSHIYVSLRPVFVNDFAAGVRRIDRQATNKQADAVRQRLQDDDLLNNGTSLLFR